MKPPSRLKKWDLINKELIFKIDPWLKLHKNKVRLHNKKVVDDYYTIEQDDHCVIFAINNEEKVLSMWQYKHGAGYVCLGLPAGYIEKNENSITAAKRELFEETGYISKNWEKLGHFFVDGNRGAGKAHIFLAREIVFKTNTFSDDLEDFELCFLDLKSLEKALFNGSIATAGPAIAVALCLLKLKN
tara:strand:+ start:61 stop:621 length:561 start_codon:yes stop_codon:yes gene_type:complete